MLVLRGNLLDGFRIRTVVTQRWRQRSASPRLLMQELSADLTAQELANRRRHRITELPSSRGRGTLNCPIVGEALEGCHFARGETTATPMEGTSCRPGLSLKRPRGSTLREL